MKKGYKNILVAVDGSKESEWALDQAIQQASLTNATIFLTHIIDTKNLTAFDMYNQNATQSLVKYAEQLLTECVNKVKEAKIENVHSILEYGSPKVKISKDLAKTHKIDLIICGATGLNAVERFLIGSVSENIVRHAKCDVLIVRTP